MRHKVTRWELLFVVGLMLILVVGLWGTSGSGLRFGSVVLAGNAPQVSTGDGSGPVTIVTPGGETGKVMPAVGAPGQVAFYTGTITQSGDNNLYWDNTNKRLGIGTASPLRKLHYYGDAALFQRDMDAAGFIIQRTDTNRWVFGASENPSLGTGFSIYTYPVGAPSATPRLFLDLDGKVGIGTTSPTLAKLQVETAGDTAIYCKDNSGGNYGYMGSSGEGVRGSSSSGTGVFGDSSSGTGVFGYSSSGIGVYGDSSSGKAGYFEGNVYASGKVGIGITTPVEKLEVAGKVKATGVCIGTDCRTAWPESLPSGTTGQTLRKNETNWVANDALFNDGTKVGIGTTSPIYKLHVETTSGVSVYGETTGSGTHGQLGGPSYGVYGYSPDTAVYGYGSSRGVQGYSGSGDGVYGSTDSGRGVYGKYGSAGPRGYLGSSDYGAYGRYSDSGPHGYLGGSIYGVYGISIEESGAGVYGTEYLWDNFGYLGHRFYGAYGEDGQNHNYGYLGNVEIGAAGYGTGGYTGVYGQSDSGYGVHGHSDSGAAVYGYSNSGAAGYFAGPVVVLGTLTKGGGSFKIDHPLDPENRYLQHSFVESPDMKNVYDGNVVLDENGEAVVVLPSYFQALNRDFRYQLTCIGGYAPVYIAEEISGNQFKIAGGKSGLKISWQVTGIRHDPFATAHPIVVEQEKPADEKGLYLHPKEWGQPEEQGVTGR